MQNYLLLTVEIHFAGIFMPANKKRPSDSGRAPLVLFHYPELSIVKAAETFNRLSRSEVLLIPGLSLWGWIQLGDLIQEHLACSGLKTAPAQTAMSDSLYCLLRRELEGLYDDYNQTLMQYWSRSGSLLSAMLCAGGESVSGVRGTSQRLR
jgi:hypothetical protein